MPEIVRLFIENGYHCEAYVTGESGEATRYLAAKSADAYDLIVCAGGDGTLNETISGMISAGMSCALGYIPSGTTNDYASSIGLSSDVLEAAKEIFTGEAKTFDIGLFNGRYFVYTATCGAFAKASYTTPQAAKNMLGHMAYVLEGIKDLANIRPMRLRVETETLSLDEEFLMCCVTNSTSVGGIIKLDANLVALNDGVFEVTLVRNPTSPGQLSQILHGLTTQDLPNEMIYFFSSGKLKISSEEPIEWTLDGERAPETASAELTNLHSTVRIIIPRDVDHTVFVSDGEEAEI